MPYQLPSVGADLRIYASYTPHIAFDGAFYGSTTYIDLRLRFFKYEDIQDFHGILIPLDGANTGENVYLHITKFLDVICPSWRSRLVGASAGGAPNMQGNLHGTVTLFEEEASAPHAEFIRVWSVLHQIALPVKDAYESIDGGAWILSTFRKIAHLRRQVNWMV